MLGVMHGARACVHSLLAHMVMQLQRLQCKQEQLVCMQVKASRRGLHLVRHHTGPWNRQMQKFLV